jgi:hypothetical protein
MSNFMKSVLFAQGLAESVAQSLYVLKYPMSLKRAQ